MARIFVCSPLRGPDGQPSEVNRELARRLMRAVFDYGHQPFVPHLLYPQVLTEEPADLHRAFAANYAFMDVCDEVWVYARDIGECSSGMRAEVEHATMGVRDIADERVRFPVVRWMPLAFERVRDSFALKALRSTARVGTCSGCGKVNGLNHAGECFSCFSGGAHG